MIDKFANRARDLLTVLAGAIIVLVICSIGAVVGIIEYGSIPMILVAALVVIGFVEQSTAMAVVLWIALVAAVLGVLQALGAVLASQ